MEAARLGGELKKDAPSGREARLGTVTGAHREIGHSLAALQPLPLVPRVLHLQMTGVGLGGGGEGGANVEARECWHLFCKRPSRRRSQALP